MFASTQDLEFVQGQSRDVPDHELALNSDKNTSSSNNSTDCSRETGIYNEDNCTYYDNISSCCSWSLNGNTSNLLEIANSSPILLGPLEAHVNTSKGCLHTSYNETMTRTEGDCSLSLILSDTSSESQLVNNGHSAFHSELSLCILNGAKVKALLWFLNRTVLAL